MTENRQKKRTIDEFNKNETIKKADAKKIVRSSSLQKKQIKPVQKENKIPDKKEEDQFAVDLKSAGKIRSLYDIFTYSPERVTDEITTLFQQDKEQDGRESQDAEFS